MEEYVIKDKKRLRCGYTTGSCAAAAAQRSTAMVLGANFFPDENVVLITPKGIKLTLPVENPEYGENWASCGIKKDSGDDPDATNGILINAKVSKIAGGKDDSNEPQIIITGGIGVGRVTKAGLACSVGEAAINPVPMKMIEEQVKTVCEEFDYSGKLLVEISIPEGVEIAKKTYNPRLGIQGGISILGTSGIVEPMSEQALVDTIKVEMNMRKANGANYLVITPGNYGETFIKNNFNLENIHCVKCSNFIGEALDYAEICGIAGVLLVGHLGKFVKLAAGMMNTHSKYGDARMEIIGIHAGLAGASKEVLEKLLSCTTTDEAISVLDETGIRNQTIMSILKKLDYHIKERVHHNLKIGAIIFSNQYGYMGETEDAKCLLKKLTE